VPAVPVPAPSVAYEGPRPEVLEVALHAHRCGRAAGQFESPILTLIDYTLPSVERRLWVIDADSGAILFRELVAHGRNSGENFARAFSNQPNSRQSSLGVFRTGRVYEGKHGISLQLAGLEPGINDRAEERQIVMHGAAYVSDTFALQTGRLGRSWGCPAVEVSIAAALIERIRDGTALIAYYPDPDWLGTSRFLHCDAGGAPPSRTQ
jgi:hypothetical protein